MEDDSEFSHKTAEVRNSVEMTNSESNISNESYNIVIMIEEGINTLSAAIDAIERRSIFRKRQELSNEELQKLNNLSNESTREKEILDKKIEILKNKLDKINENLTEEINDCLKNIEKSTIKYISGLARVRKSHMIDQKDHWKKIATHVSLNSQ